METLAKRARGRRLELGLNQATLAEMSGLKQSDISKIENGLILKTTGLVALAKALRCEPQWLATGEGDMVSANVWPFALLTPDDVRRLSPKAMEIVERQAISLLDLQTTATVHKAQTDTVAPPKSEGFPGTQQKPEFMKAVSGKRSADPRTPRKTGNG
jgi:transcriptional regulator with XRE-family HTH domain